MVILAEAYQPTSRLLAVAIIYTLVSEPVRQAWENNVNRPARFDNYFKRGGLNEQFQSQKPTDQRIGEINKHIAAAFAELTADGIEMQGKKFYLPCGRDMISLKDFKLTKLNEWCALSQSEGHFNLVTIATANDLIQHGSAHPISREALQISDFIRGDALLDLFEKR